MSRGPGRIERAIEVAFSANPSMTFTVDDLAVLAYPGLNRVEKKHRVAVIRATDRVAARLWWRGRRMERPGHPVVYFNLLDHRSYIIGKIRVADCPRDLAHAEINEAIDNPDTDLARADSWRRDAAPGSAFWMHVEINRAEHAGENGRATELRSRLHAELAEHRARL